MTDPESYRFCGEAYREWPHEDVLVGPCRWLAAHFADRALDDAWTNGDCTDWPGCCMFWHDARDTWLRTSAASCWIVQLRYTRKEIN